MSVVLIFLVWLVLQESGENATRVATWESANGSDIRNNGTATTKADLPTGG